MSNIMSLPGQAGTRAPNGAQVAGNAPAPDSPFAAFIQTILGGFLGGQAVTGTAGTAPPQLFAGLTLFGAGNKSDAVPGQVGDRDEKPGPAHDAGITTTGQMSLISAFAPVQANVPPVEVPVTGETVTSEDASDPGPAAKPTGMASASLSTSSASSFAGEPEMLLSLLSDVSPAGQASSGSFAQSDAGSSPSAASRPFNGISPENQDASYTGGSQATIGDRAGIDAEKLVALALDAVADTLRQGVTPSAPSQKPDGAQSQQDTTRSPLAPARSAEVPLVALQGDSPVQDTVPAPRAVRTHETGTKIRRDVQITDHPDAEQVADDSFPGVRDVVKPAPVIADDALETPQERPSTGDAPVRSQAPAPGTGRSVDASGEETSSAPAAGKERTGDASRAQQPAPGNAQVTPQAPADRSATQTVVPPADVIGRPSTVSPAAPRQEIPAPYATLPPELSRHIADQVVRNLAFQVDGTTSEMHMTLKPPSLGQVDLHVHVEDSKVAAQIDVSQQLVKSALEAHMPQLRQALQEHGIEVQRIDVMIPGQSMQQGGAGSGGERTGRRGGRRAAAGLDDEPVQAVKDMGYNTIELIM
ncbi:MAG TPA: flagellar hook-length control protein FliK [Bacteroidota bacterium]|nr:flagellar hook-length control protein FliK [Bacteroidota bacterium]